MALVTLDAVSNLTKITPIGTYNAVQTAITVSLTDAAKLPAVPFNIVWWQQSAYSDPSDDPNVEIDRVTNTNLGTGVLTLTRGQEGIAATTKNGGGVYKMIVAITAKMITDIQTGMNAGVAGPGSATDNAIARFDGVTGLTIQNSGPTISDGGGIATTIAASGNTVGLTVTQNDTINNPDAVDIVNAGTGKSLKITNGATEAFTVRSTGFVGINQGTPTSTFHNNGSFAKAYRAITASRTLDATDSVIECTSGTFPVTLPTAVGITGREYTIKLTGTGTITVGTTSSQTIDGATSIIMSIQYQSMTVVSNGANWIIT